MATPNYGYEKRQKELAKKRKKEDKLKAKSERKLGENGEELEPNDTPGDTPVAGEQTPSNVPPAV